MGNNIRNNTIDNTMHIFWFQIRLHSMQKYQPRIWVQEIPSLHEIPALISHKSNPANASSCNFPSHIEKSGDVREMNSEKEFLLCSSPQFESLPSNQRHNGRNSVNFKFSNNCDQNISTKRAYTGNSQTEENAVNLSVHNRNTCNDPFHSNEKKSKNKPAAENCLPHRDTFIREARTCRTTEQQLVNLVDKAIAKSISFPETSFITVTAYQNQQVTNFK